LIYAKEFHIVEIFFIIVTTVYNSIYTINCKNKLVVLKLYKELLTNGHIDVSKFEYSNYIDILILWRVDRMSINNKRITALISLSITILRKLFKLKIPQKVFLISKKNWKI